MRTCSFAGCDRPEACVGLCAGHYRHKRIGQPLKPLKKYRRTDGTNKQCGVCEAVKPLTEFGMRKSGTPTSACKPCLALRSKRYYAAYKKVKA